MPENWGIEDTTKVSTTKLISIIINRIRLLWVHITNTTFFFLALCEIFDKADTDGGGAISIDEYLAICGEYGKEVDDDDLDLIKALCNENGEVSKNDFIMHLKKHGQDLTLIAFTKCIYYYGQLIDGVIVFTIPRDP